MRFWCCFLRVSLKADRTVCTTAEPGARLHALITTRHYKLSYRPWNRSSESIDVEVESSWQPLSWLVASIGLTWTQTQRASMHAGVKHLDVHIYIVTLLYNKYYNPLISCTDLSKIPVRSAAKSYLTSWCIQNLSKRALNRLTVSWLEYTVYTYYNRIL